MNGLGHPKLEPTRLDLSVLSSSTTDDAFPDASDPTLFTMTNIAMRLSVDDAHNITKSPAESDTSSLASPSPITSPSSASGADTGVPGSSLSSASKMYLPSHSQCASRPEGAAAFSVNQSANRSDLDKSLSKTPHAQQVMFDLQQLADQPISLLQMLTLSLGRLQDVRRDNKRGQDGRLLRWR